jgi:dehydrogenase/reductase SDR family protein 7
MFFGISSFLIIVTTSLLAVIPDANLSLFLYDKFVNKKMLKNTLSGKRIWITGCSSGIGEELASQLHSHGANLILSGRRETELVRVKEKCLDSMLPAHPEIHILPFDITDEIDNLQNVVSSAVQLYSGIDILILNAGSGQLSPALDNDSHDYRSLMEVNFWGPTVLAQLLIKEGGWSRTPRRGHIFVTSSIASKMSLPLGSSYAASKAALHAFFSSLRSEYGDWLRIDLSCPGPIATSFQSKVKGSPIAAGENNDSETKMPVKRCAALMISAIHAPAFLSMETWISSNPTLGFMYLNQYFPNVSNILLSKVIGPLRLKAFRAGLPLYKTTSFLKAAKMDD